MIFLNKIGRKHDNITWIVECDHTKPVVSRFEFEPKIIIRIL
jgi:hypothetical protein